MEIPNLRKSTPYPKCSRKKRKASNRLVSHHFHILHDSSDDDDIPFRIVTEVNERPRDALAYARNRISVWKNRAMERASANESDNSNEKTDLHTQDDDEEEELETEENDAGKECCSETSKVQAIIEHEPLGCSQTKVRDFEDFQINCDISNNF